MDCGFNINHVLPEEMTVVDATADFWKNTSVGGGREFMRQEICTIIDRIGEGSAQAQGLLTPITSSTKLRASDHKLFILKDATANQYRGGILGYLKTAKKKLIIFDGKGEKRQYEPLCILDFFIDPANQRQGYGTKLFNFALQREHAEAKDVAIDRPSTKCLSFMERKYHLTDVIRQPSHFVVFSDFFANNPGIALDTRAIAKENGSSNGGPAEKYQNGFTAHLDEYDQVIANGHSNGHHANGKANGMLTSQYSSGAAGTETKMHAPDPDAPFRGSLRPTKGTNLHYQHTTLW